MSTAIRTWYADDILSGHGPGSDGTRRAEIRARDLTIADYPEPPLCDAPDCTRPATIERVVSDVVHRLCAGCAAEVSASPLHVYEIRNTISGTDLGGYEAASGEEALDLWAQDAGYEDYAHACRVAPVRPGEIVTVLQSVPAA